MLSGLRGEDSIAELCRREGIVQNLYYRWSKEFLEAGKKRLAGDTARAATSDEVKELRREASVLKEVVAELTLGKPIAEKNRDRGRGRRSMRYPAAEKLEIIQLVEQSPLPSGMRSTRDSVALTDHSGPPAHHGCADRTSGKRSPAQCRVLPGCGAPTTTMLKMVQAT